MTDIVFYLQQQPEQGDAVTIDQIACFLCAQYYQQKAKVMVLCRDKAHAEQLDELLWQLPAQRFVPHNLSGEGPKNGTPVEICWQQSNNIYGKYLINLTANLPVNYHKCRQVADFVPIDEQQKQSARERYKQYRAAGHAMRTENAAEMIESNHG